MYEPLTHEDSGRWVNETHRMAFGAFEAGYKNTAAEMDRFALELAADFEFVDEAVNATWGDYLSERGRPMDDSKLSEMERLHGEATPGPWDIDEYGIYLFASDGNGPVMDTTEREGEPGAVLSIRGHGAGRPMKANGRFVSALVNAAPELFAAVRERSRLSAAHFEVMTERDAAIARAEKAEARVAELEREA